MKIVNIITLGCAKNRVDSEHVAAQLAEAGYEIRFDSDRTDAKVVVINTCGFIGDAKEESIDTILSCVEAKRAGLIDKLFVIGCLSERYADELREEIPEVDDYFGARTFDGVVRALTGDYREDIETKRELSTPKHYALARGVIGDVATAPFRSSAVSTARCLSSRSKKRHATLRPRVCAS